MTLTGNKYLDGVFAPLPAEVTATELTVIGELPVELDGRYLRNGPNPIAEADPATYHWFVGDGMAHGLRLRDGRAEWYRARWIRSTHVSEVLGEDPAPGERFGGFDGPNTNVVGIAGRAFAVVEAGARPVELDDELGTVEHSDLGGTLPHGYTAHPKVDPTTGEAHAISYHWAVPGLEYSIIGTDGRVRHLETIDVPDGPMVHDCSITERWMVVYDLPVTFDLEQAMSGVRLPYAWNDAHPARLGLLPLGGRGDEVRWFDINPCYVFHPLNAYDDGDKVMLDVVRYGRMFDAKPLGPDDTSAHLWRFTVDTATGRVTEEQLSDQTMEFPRVDERVVGRPHRWGYSVEIARQDDGNDFAGGRLVRIDGTSGATELVDLGAGRRSGEWVMVPRHADAAEDDGWLLSLVYDANTDRSELVVLPAAEPSAGPVARVLLPTRVPPGFHGNWLPTPTGSGPI